jgi:hypothetical protein
VLCLQKTDHIASENPDLVEMGKSGSIHGIIFKHKALEKYCRAGGIHNLRYMIFVSR